MYLGVTTLELSLFKRRILFVRTLNFLIQHPQQIRISCLFAPQSKCIRCWSIDWGIFLPLPLFFFLSLFFFLLNSCKLQQYLQWASKPSDNAINFIRKMKSYSAINSKSGTKQQPWDTGLQYLALNSEIQISPISSGLCLMFTPAYIPQIQPSGHSVNTPQYLLQLVFD